MRTSTERIFPQLLKGHNDTVTCLAYNRSTGVLLSGSEDGTVRVWDDLSSSNNSDACRCSIEVKAEVDGDNIEVNSVAFHPDYDDDSCKVIYVAVGNSLLEYDLMENIVDSKLKVRRDLSDDLKNGDDINQVSTQTFENELCIATCNDDGEIHVLCGDGTLKVLMHSTVSKVSKPSGTDIIGAAIVTSAVFRPHLSSKSRKNSNKGKKKSSSNLSSKMLISGGTDCVIKLWDIEKPHSSTYSLIIKTMNSEENVNQICNPPMIHHIGWSISGKLVSAGLGDGSVIIFKIEGKRIIELDRLFRNGHTVAVACVCWPRYIFDTKNDVTNDRFLITVGSDGFILFWDIGINSSPLAKSPSEVLDFSNNVRAGHESEPKTSFEGLDESKIIYRINHGTKLNWITSRTIPDNGSLEVIVADVSKDISIYTIPRRR